MRVYRIENSKGEGPYMHRGWETRNHSFLPTPSEEGIDRLASDYCGFSKIKKLKRWFTKNELKNLRRLGFKLSVYETNEVKKGKQQLVFNRSNSVFIEYLDY